MHIFGGGTGGAALDALETLSERIRYARWLFELARPFIGKRVVEAGSGLGTMTAFLAEEPGRSVLATDADPAMLERLCKRFTGFGNVAVRQWRLPEPPQLDDFKPDTFVMWNVLEHIEDDVRVLAEVARALPVGGKVVIYSPAGEWLFCPFDRRLGHFRRYRRRELTRKSRIAGLTPLVERPCNLIGALSWLVRFRFFGASHIGRMSTGLFDLLAPALQRLEELWPPPTGLSVLFVAERPGTP